MMKMMHGVEIFIIIFGNFFLSINIVIKYIYIYIFNNEC